MFVMKKIPNKTHHTDSSPLRSFLTALPAADEFKRYNFWGKQ